MHTLVIGAAAAILSILQSFVIHKVFVFRTIGNWSNELCRSYIVYGFGSLLSVGLLWLMVDGLGLTIYVSQAVIMGLIAFLSYIGHLKYTFKN